MTDTIYALASGRGRAGVAVLRLSGPNSYSILRDLAGQSVCETPRRLDNVTLVSRETSTVLDQALAVFFQQPASFTGEDVVELHVHGGSAVIQAVLSELSTFAQARSAEPGEFTRRAFLNGKMDLTAAEGLADLVDAETEAQRQQALRQSGGEVADIYDGWRERLVKLMAYFEATIDFAEEDIPDDLLAQVAAQVATLHSDIGDALSDHRRGERLRDGISVAIVGPPNAGKSSLLNALVQREAAIVSDIAGTTRDVLEVHMDLGGYPVLFADTAGLRETSDTIEKEGVRRALQRFEHADLTLFIQPADEALDPHSRDVREQADVVVFNKMDQATAALSEDAHPLSVKTGEGLSGILSVIRDRVAQLFDSQEPALITRTRHREALQDCFDALTRFDVNASIELAAEDLRLAARALGRITGRVDVDELLDVVFRDFCIGK